MDSDSDAILRQPPAAGNELDTLLGAPERQRGYVAWKCGNLDSAGLRATLGPSTVTLGGLLKHLAAVEDDMFSVKLYGRIHIRPGPPWTGTPTGTGSGTRRPTTAPSSSRRRGRRRWADLARWSARRSPTAAWIGSLSPVHIPSADEFLAANAKFIEDYRLLGSAIALDRFLARVIGPAWRTEIEHHVPGGATQVQRDADTFFATDMPALVTWRFLPEDAQRIGQAVLYIGGSESGPWFAQVRDLILSWLPQAQDVVLEGADHSLAITHPAQVAAALKAFLRDQPIGA